MPDHQRINGYDRVRSHGSSIMNARLDRELEGNLVRAEEDPAFAVRRLGELEHEWDIDRAIMIGFAAMGTVALGLALRRDRRFRFPLAAQIGFLLLHSVIGWCPPAAVLRRFGFRTRQEIDDERFSLALVRAPSAE